MKENQWFAVAPLSGKIFTPPRRCVSDRAKDTEPYSNIPEDNQKPLLKLMNEWGVDFPLWTSEHYPAQPENFPELSANMITDLQEWAALYNSADPDSNTSWLTYVGSIDSSRYLAPAELHKLLRYEELRDSLLKRLTDKLGNRYRIECID